MANDDVDLDALLDQCERSIKWLSNAQRLEGQQYLLGARNALADPSGEDRQEAIRNLRLFHEYMARYVGGDFTLPSAADPPALQAVRELRRRTQRDELRRRRRKGALAWATLGVAVVGAVFAVLTYAFPRSPDPAPPAAPGLEQPTPAPISPLTSPTPPSPGPQLPPGR